MTVSGNRVREGRPRIFLLVRAESTTKPLCSRTYFANIMHQLYLRMGFFPLLNSVSSGTRRWQISGRRPWMVSFRSVIGLKRGSDCADCDGALVPAFSWLL
jgi:hypothetical protein